MSDYRAPVMELAFVLKHVAGLDSVAALPGFDSLDDDLVTAILDEAGRFSEERVAPTNQQADRQGTGLENRQVVTAPALDGLYQAYREGGWPGLTGDTAHGGQGLPQTLGFAVQEILQSANTAFALLPMLTQGVITALGRYGSAEQQALYLPKLTSGEWAGTMNLTEPQAGSDLGQVKTRAEREGDHYRLFGQKIFITWGDQPYTDNIVHLVLARTPDAPAGVKGISLFIVPKFLVTAEGGIGERNDVYPIGVERKLGIHASPTCTMAYGDNGGAIGYLVGDENQGLKYMFAMMNHARLAVGLQGVSLAERACQHALGYARERLQGTRQDRGPVAIAEHPDVRRMVLTMQALTQAGRALALSAMHHFDHATHSADDSERARHQQRVDLLTPLVKGWCTEIVNEVTSLAVQVHGGMGFIEETGVAQYYRDARILAIYEGTNGIQALDLVGRKLLANGGEYATDLLRDLRDIVGGCRAAGLDPLADRLEQALGLATDGVRATLTAAQGDPDYAGAVAFNLLMLLGTSAAGCYLAKGAAKAAELSAAEPAASTFYQRKIVVARVFAEQVLPRCLGYHQAVLAGGEALMAGEL
ncbi:MAG: acyl-CoA dehydrogenase [Porticoccaceae bacterium]